MRVDMERLGNFRSRTIRTTDILSWVSFFLLPLSAFFLFCLCYIWVDPPDRNVDSLIVTLLCVLFFLLFFGTTIFLTVWKRRLFFRLRRFIELAVASSKGAELSTDDPKLEEETGLSRKKLLVILSQAIKDGVIINDASGRENFSVDLCAGSLTTYNQAESKLISTIVLSLFVGAAFCIFALFALLVGLLVYVTPHDPARESSSTPLIASFFMGFVCGLPMIFPARWGFRKGLVTNKKRRLLEELALFATSGSPRTGEEISDHLSLDPKSTLELILDARSLKVLQTRRIASVSQSDAETLEKAPTVPQKLLESTESDKEQTLAETCSGKVLKATYRIDTKIGRGGMGIVYRAIQLRTGRPYAVKVLLPNARLSQSAIERFRREALAVSGLMHPSIIGVHDFDVTEEGLNYIVMDLLEGETLDNILGRRGSLPWQEACRLIRKLGKALAAAHNAGFLHRDIKPGNIFILPPDDEENHPVLLDFGLAKPLDPNQDKLTRTGDILGTPLYMSPEQARGEAVDQRTDIYSLGAVFYELLTGAPPFYEPTLGRFYAKLLNEEPKKASQSGTQKIPPVLDSMIDTMLAKKADQRFQTMEAVLNALESILDS